MSTEPTQEQIAALFAQKKADAKAVEKRIESGVLKISKIVKKGYLPRRGNEGYACLTSSFRLFGDYANCLSHACFNFSNQEIDELALTCDETIDTFGTFLIPYFDECKSEQEMGRETEKRVIERIGLTGLEMKASPLNKPLLKNQWRVALYINYNYPDFHFLRQEKSGVWTAKDGYSYRIERYGYLPTECSGGYKYLNSYVITNPYYDLSVSTPTEKMAQKLKRQLVLGKEKVI